MAPATGNQCHTTDVEQEGHGVQVYVGGSSGAGWLHCKTGGAPTVTVVEAELEPPAPVQVRKKFVVDKRLPVDWLPVTDLLPLHPPLAEQVVAPDEFQERLDELPEVTEPGLAVIETDGGLGPAITVTITLLEVVPPAPVQLSVNVVFATSDPETCDPEVDLPPDHPPDALQVVAPVELQDRFVVLPELTVVGFAVNVKVGGAAFTVTVTLSEAEPPGPVQVIRKLVVVDKFPVD